MNYIQELRSVVGTRPLILTAAGVILLDAEGRILLQHRTDTNDWGGYRVALWKLVKRLRIQREERFF
ncbi:hypothetical protein GCM10020331_058590 [Ectobacillus funiculus]